MAKKILIADDERMIVDMLEIRLEAAGYEVKKAYDGAGALDSVKDFSPDLIILDIMMPPPDGLEVCRRVKSDPNYKNIRIIMLTAKSVSNTRELSAQAGADGYISKPYDAAELMARIKELIGE